MKPVSKGKVTNANNKECQLSRRFFLKGLACSAWLPHSLASPIKNELEAINLYSAATDQVGSHWLVITSVAGKTLNQLQLPSRAHQVLKHPSLPLLCVVARRPGKYIAIVDSTTGELTKTLTPSKGYHFYGHGVFSNDGRYLITSENHIESGDGCITVRDRLLDFAVSRRFVSHGIGPHEIKLSKNNKVLVVANGGIKTHPAKGRQKLNLPTMRPSLVYLEFNTGKLIDKVELPDNLYQLSIRHIDINQFNHIVIAMQYQGDKTDQVSLVATHKQGEKIKLLYAPIESYLAMKHYCGSVCFESSGRYAAATAPKGDLLTVWDTEQSKIFDQVRCRDVCGIASLGKQGFVATSGAGKLYYYNIEHKSLIHVGTYLHKLDSSIANIKKEVSSVSGRLAWDNHLSIG